jgi:hypothetical protein
MHPKSESTTFAFARSDMTPCVLRDGDICYAEDFSGEPICVGCERTPPNLAERGRRIGRTEPAKILFSGPLVARHWALGTERN